MENAIKIRLANASDLPQLMVISDRVDYAAHWTSQQWLDIFHAESPARYAWIAQQQSSLGGNLGIGFLVAQDLGLDWELENIAVLPEFRRAGTGRALLSALFEQFRLSQAESILLEVRESNESALRFYNLSGFQLLGRRRDYYRNPPEDALILVHRNRN